MKLSPDVRRVWRRFSFQAMGWSLGFIAWWQSDAMPAWKLVIGDRWAVGIVAVLLLAGMLGACVDQPKAKVPPGNGQ